jgi:RNA polymerase sigma factor for flagellar operon FliA
MDAIDKYDPTRKVKFETYCAKRIHGTIVDDIRHNDWVPRLVRSRAKQLEKVTQKLLSLFGRSPTETEMAGELGMEMEEFYHFQRDANALGLISLNTKVSDSDGECEGIDFIADQKSQNPLFDIQRQDLKEFITKGFSRQERLVVVLYYFEQMTMKEIGETLGISESRVCQLHSSLIARLRVQMKMTGLSMCEQHVI